MKFYLRYRATPEAELKVYQIDGAKFNDDIFAFIDYTREKLFTEEERNRPDPRFHEAIMRRDQRALKP